MGRSLKRKTDQVGRPDSRQLHRLSAFFDISQGGAAFDEQKQKKKDEQRERDRNPNSYDKKKKKKERRKDPNEKDTPYAINVFFQFKLSTMEEAESILG